MRGDGQRSCLACEFSEWILVLHDAGWVQDVRRSFVTQVSTDVPTVSHSRGSYEQVVEGVCALEKLSSCDQLDIFVVPRVRRLYLCHTAANVRPWGVFVSRFDIHGMQVIEQHVVSG